jgi:hypothetical protein
VSDGFLVGLVVGLAVGWLANPLVRWWLAAKEWREASRELELADELLRRMAQDDHPRPKEPHR